MNKHESLADFYQAKFPSLQANTAHEIGHFNVFKLDPFVGASAKAVPYRRRDYYKISFIKGNNIIHYADKTVEIKKQALLFANPQVPYSWEEIDKIQTGSFCVFTPSFFYDYGQLEKYAVFQPLGKPIYELTDEQALNVEKLYERMFVEMDSDYIHKYDILRSQVFELIHIALKLDPSPIVEQADHHAAKRLTLLFFEYLERQFPIDRPSQHIQLRSPADFATSIGVHVNHLNRALKEITQKTTSQIIDERILQEAKIILKHSAWQVSEIAYALGFREVTHFNNFFKKHVLLSPNKYRMI